MPSHRAYYASAEEARAAATKAVERLNARWTAAATAAGEQAGTTPPVVGVKVESVTLSPVLPTPGHSSVALRITAPDGRSETAHAHVRADEAELFLDKSSGTVTFERILLGFLFPKVRVRARVAKSITVTVFKATAVTTSHIVEDRYTGKRFRCVATTLSSKGTAGEGTYTVDVTEIDTGDTSEVTHGSVLEFVSAPDLVSPIVRVNAMKGFTFADGLQLRDPAGRIYETAEGASIADSVDDLVGDLYADLFVYRTRTDGIDDETPLAVDDSLTFETTPSGVGSSVAVVSNVPVADATLPKDGLLTAVVDGRTYQISADTPFNDYGDVDVPFRAVDRGPENDRAIGDVLTFLSGVGVVAGTVASSRGATSFPIPYAPQIVGAAQRWNSLVHRATDGRWVCDVFTEPHGS